MQFSFTKTQQTIIRKLGSHGGPWVVGGGNRDLLLSRQPKDIDFATNLLPDRVITLINDFGLTRIPDATAYHHGIIRVVDQTTGEIIDIATTRRDTRCDGRHCTPVFTNDITEDLARRDFTINAIATKVDHLGNILSVIDPFNGIVDIKNKIVRFVGDPEQRIKEDALRMVRACRFKALDPYMCSMRIRIPIQKLAHNIASISKERIRDEILKSLSYPAPDNFWKSMYNYGLLDIVFPELVLTIGCTQNKHHNYEDVWSHIIRTLKVSQELTDNPLLRLAAICHDIGKPPTKTIDEKGEVHFYKHEVASAEIVYKWMQEYKFSNDQCEYVSKICRWHQWRFDDKIKTRTLKRWLQQVGKDLWEDLFTIRCADRRGNIAKQNMPMITKQMWELYNKTKDIIDNKEPLFREDLAINGNDIKDLGIKPGPKYKEMFGNLLAIVIADPSKNTKEYLLEWVESHRKQFEK